MDKTAKKLSFFDLRRRDITLSRGGRTIAAIIHAERNVNIFPREDIHALPADDLNNSAECDVAQTTVTEFLAGLTGRLE